MPPDWMSISVRIQPSPEYEFALTVYNKTKRNNTKSEKVNKPLR